MPAISSLSLTDGTTPVTLSPISHVAGETRYRASAADVTAANQSLVFQYKEQSGVQRQTVRFTEPVTAVDSNTGETLVRENVIVEVSVRVPGVCTSATRETAIRRAFDAIGAGALETELTTGEGQW